MKNNINYIDAKNVIWIQTAFIGDIVLSTSAMNALKSIRPDVNQYLITTPIGKTALSGSSLFEEVFALDKKKGIKENFSLAKNIRSLKLPKSETVILQPHKSLRSSILSMLLGFKWVTYKESSLSFLASTTVDRVALLHESRRIALMLEPMGISREKSFEFKPKIDAVECSDKFKFLNHPTIAIAPGSVWGTKKWKLEGFLEVAVSILDNLEFNLALIGSPNEIEDTNHIQENIDKKYSSRIINLAGKTNLAELREIYPKFKAVVCNDSSPIHYASAFNIPTVSVFGATKPSMGFGPLSDDSTVVEHKTLDCRPCSDHGPKVCPKNHFKCMREVSSDDVFGQLKSVLKLS
jgi:heptosyltransferase-2